MTEAIRPEGSGVYHRLARAMGQDGAKRLRAWAGLGVGALGVAGLFAVLLAVSRVPGIQDVSFWPLEFFKKGLVIHVVFSFVVWFLCVFGAILELGARRLGASGKLDGIAGQAALWGVGISFPLLFVPALLDRGDPTLNNYVPAIIDPIYYAGLFVLAGAMAVQSFRVLVRVPNVAKAADPLTVGALAGALGFLLALACIRLAAMAMWDMPLSHHYNEEVFWGGGHVFQIVNTAMMIAAWWVLASLAWGESVIANRMFGVAIVLISVLALPAPGFYIGIDGDLPRQAFTDLQYTEILPLVIAGVAVILAASVKSRTARWSDPAFLGLILSMAVFAVGGALGVFVDGTDARTPGHYHGVIAGLNLAFMGLFLTVILPLAGRPAFKGKKIAAQFWMFAVGQGAAAVGLFIAGGHGASRKAAGAAQGLDELGVWAKVGMGMNGAGGLLAVLGGVLFVWTVATALLRKNGDQVGH